MDSDFNSDKAFKIVPIIISLILIGLFIPYIQSQTLPIEVEVEVPYAFPNFNVTNDFRNFDNTFISNVSDTSIIKNWSLSTPLTSSSYTTTTSLYHYYAFTIEKDMRLENLTQYLFFGTTAQINITLCNATLVDNYPIPDQVISDINISQVYTTQQFYYRINDIALDLYVNQTANNIFFLKYQMISGFVRTGYVNTNYTLYMQYNTVTFDKVFSVDLDLQMNFTLLNSSNYNLNTENISVTDLSLTLSNVTENYEIILHNNKTNLITTNENFILANIRINANSSILDFDLNISSNILLVKDMDYNISIANCSMYVNLTDKYYNYFQITFEIVILINSIANYVYFNGWFSCYL